MTKQQHLSRRTVIALAAGASFSLAFLVARTATAQMAELESPKAKSVVALVDKAAALVGSKGKAAFDDFRQKGSEWFTGDIYIFCSDMEGTELFNAAFPQFEGKHLIDLKDKSGKAITRAFIAMVEKQGAGWVDYMWPKPGTDTPVKKWSYVKRVDVEGKTPAFLGIGIYLD
jgi:cytochrome c